MFDSNSVTFSVSAPATNAARFFRLKQPADLRGIYVYVGPDSATNSPDAVPLMAARRAFYPLGPTNPLRSQYIEVWATNAVTFTNAIWQAHQELLTPP